MIDTLSGSTGGLDENHVQVSQAVSDTHALGPFATLWVHHEGHGDKGRMRGSSGLIAAADAIIRAKRQPWPTGTVLPEGHWLLRLDDRTDQGGKRKDTEPTGALAFLLGDPDGLTDRYRKLGLEDPEDRTSATILGPWLNTAADIPPEAQRLADVLADLGGKADGHEYALALGLSGPKNLARKIRPATDAGLVEWQPGKGGRPSLYWLNGSMTAHEQRSHYPSTAPANGSMAPTPKGGAYEPSRAGGQEVREWIRDVIREEVAAQEAGMTIEQWRTYGGGQVPEDTGPISDDLTIEALLNMPLREAAWRMAAQEATDQ